MVRRKNTFAPTLVALRTDWKQPSWAVTVSPRKVFRLAIVLMMSFLCWLGVGYFAFEVVQLAAR
jgi:hypothetical protein